MIRFLDWYGNFLSRLPLWLAVFFWFPMALVLGAVLLAIYGGFALITIVALGNLWNLLLGAFA